MEQIDLFASYWNENQGFAAILMYFVAIAALCVSTIAAEKQLRLMVEIEREKARPYLTLDFHLFKHCGFVTLRNTGSTPALDVRVKVTPEIGTLLGGANSHPPEERMERIPFLDGTIPCVAPGRILEGLMGHVAEINLRYPDRRFQGTITYRDSRGAKFTEFVDTSLPCEGHVLTRYDIHDLAVTVDKMRNEIRLFCSGHHTPHVRVTPEKEYQEQQKEELAAAEASLRQSGCDEADTIRDSVS